MGDSTRQASFYSLLTSRKEVRGNFYLDGRRVQKKLFSFRELGLTDEGLLPSASKRAFDQLNAKVLRKWEEVQRELEAGKAKKGKKKAVKIGEVMEEWITLSEPTRSKRTVNNHFKPLRLQYLELVGNHDLEAVSLRQVDRFIAGLDQTGNSKVTINLKLRTLKSFLNWAAAREYLEKVPKIKFLPTIKKIPKTLTDAQLDQLMARIVELQKKTTSPGRKRFYHLHQRFLLIAVATGFRLQEIFWLKWDQVDFVNNLVMVRSSTRFETKEKKEKARYIPSYLCDYLRAEHAAAPGEIYLFDDGTGNLAYADPSALTTAFGRHFKALGFDGQGIKRVHGFRALFATRLKNQLHIDSRVIQQMLGHSDIRVTESYFGLPEVAQRTAIEALNEHDKEFYKRASESS